MNTPALPPDAGLRVIVNNLTGISPLMGVIAEALSRFLSATPAHPEPIAIAPRPGDEPMSDATAPEAAPEVVKTPAAEAPAETAPVVTAEAPAEPEAGPEPVVETPAPEVTADEPVAVDVAADEPDDLDDADSDDAAE